MHARFLVTAIGLSVSLALGPARADDWAGFYVGIDQLDGSLDRLSIAPNGEGAYSFTLAASKFGSCEAVHPEAVLTGVGRIADKALVVSDAAIWCAGSQGDPLHVSDLSLDVDTEFGELTFPAASDGRRLRFTRISVGSNPSDDWVGFYIGIDGADGSIDRTAITKNDNGTYGITIKATKFGTCPSAHAAAVQTATGEVTAGKLVRRNTSRRCDDSSEVISIRDAAYTRDPETGILTLPAPSDGRPLYQHRIGN
jgi:hypothetical protein